MSSPVPTLPLIRHFQPGIPLAWTEQPVSAQQFLAQAAQLARSLPDGRYIINLCEDRYHFLLAFAAALIAGRHTLTPASRAVDAIAGIQRDFDGSHMVDDPAIAHYLRGFPASASSDLAPLAIPEIPADQLAITLFTSGSSGQPTAHSKTWGMLVQGADQLQRAFDVAPGVCVIGTVPPQHMFGLESTIVFPLQWGCTTHHERPLLPTDIERVLHAVGAPVWLMTTPVHLRACVAEQIAANGVAGAISATMPLDRGHAQAAEKILHCPLYEIYGCTEAGITATRRPACDLEWRLCPDFRLRMADGLGWLEGPRVTQPLALADSIEMRTPECFTLHGRAGDMIKIAGKRTTLAALNAALLAIDGVGDGSFYRPDSQEGDQHEDRRLSAFVVAPDLSTRAIVAELRKRIDAAFIPRPLSKVAQLPRDANGKLTRIELEKLAARVAAKQAGNDARGHGIVAADHPALDGHFPGAPIVPGVLLLSEVMRMAARCHRVTGIKQAKFHAPLGPDQAYAIELDPVSPATIKFTIKREQSMIASGLLQCEAEHAAD